MNTCFYIIFYIFNEIIHNYFNFRRWYINVPAFKKDHVHRALPDVKESIRELQYYKDHIFDLCIKS